MAKSELPLKPKQLTLMKHLIQGAPPPPPPPLPSSSVPSVEGSLENITDTTIEGLGDLRLEEIVHSEDSSVSVNDPSAEQSPSIRSQHCSSKDELFDDRVTSSATVSEPAPLEGVARRLRKGNLKSADSQRKSRRVSFDPLALLLDASLEGELELVQKTALEVTIFTRTILFDVYVSMGIYEGGEKSLNMYTWDLSNSVLQNILICITT